jgi:hypothetical protein
MLGSNGNHLERIMLKKTRLMKVKYKEVTVAAFTTNRNTRRRGDLTAGSEAGNVKKWAHTNTVLAGLRKPCNISSAITVESVQRNEFRN